MIEAMIKINEMELHIIGDGDIIDELKNKVNNLALTDKILFFGKLHFSKLQKYTDNASIGISLEEDICKNYRYSMPNKVFDYLQAGLPVIISKYTEASKIIERYKLGLLVEIEPTAIANAINSLITNNILNVQIQQNISKKRKDFCWQNEEKKIVLLFQLM